MRALLARGLAACLTVGFRFARSLRLTGAVLALYYFSPACLLLAQAPSCAGAVDGLPNVTSLRMNLDAALMLQVDIKPLTREMNGLSNNLQLNNRSTFCASREEMSNTRSQGRKVIGEIKAVAIEAQDVARLYQSVATTGRVDPVDASNFDSAAKALRDRVDAISTQIEEYLASLSVSCAGAWDAGLTDSGMLSQDAQYPIGDAVRLRNEIDNFAKALGDFTFPRSISCFSHGQLSGARKRGEDDIRSLQTIADAVSRSVRQEQQHRQNRRFLKSSTDDLNESVRKIIPQIDKFLDSITVTITGVWSGDCRSSDFRAYIEAEMDIEGSNAGVWILGSGAHRSRVRFDFSGIRNHQLQPKPGESSIQVANTDLSGRFDRQYREFRGELNMKRFIKAAGNFSCILAGEGIGE